MLLPALAMAYTANPGCTPSNGSFYGKVRLNEVKSQGGGSGLDFVEIYVIDNNVSLTGFKIGVSGYSGKPGGKWIESGSIATLALGNGDGCVDYTGSKSGFSSCALKDNSSATWNYGRYILYDLPNMDQQSGQIVLFDSSNRIVDFVAYSSGASCDTARYWQPPSVGDSCYNVHNCITNVSASNADLSRNVDGTGEWTPRSGSGSQGTTNMPGGPAGGVGYRFQFAVSCVANAITVTMTAVWIDVNGNFLSGNPVYTGASGAVVVSSSVADIVPSAASLVNGKAEFNLTGAGVQSGASVVLSAYKPELPGTWTQSGPIVLPGCAVNAESFDCLETALTYIPNPSPPARNPLYTKLAGSPFSLKIVALKSDGTVETNYGGPGDQARTVAVELVDDCASTLPLASLNATFSENTGLAEASSFNVASANKVVACRVRDASTGKTACSADRFSIRPSSVSLQTSATSASAPAPADPSVIRAGANFALKAVTSPSYTGDLLLDTGRLGAQKPDNGTTQQAGGTVGTLTPATLPANSDTNAAYSEVGYLYLAPGAYRDETFTAASGDRASGDCILPNPADPLDFGYLSDVPVGGKYGCDIGNKSALAFGRFIPYRFKIAPDTVTPACSGVFTYFGQDGFTTRFSLAAQNSGAGATKNYQGVFARFDLTDHAAYRFAVSSATPLPTGAALAASATAPSGGPWSEGLATVEARHLVVRPSDKAGITPVQVVAEPLDADGVTTAASETVSVADTPLRYGRLQIGNAHGSELLDLPVPLVAQYWDGSMWKTNTEDNCSSINPKAVAFSGWTGNLGACETSFALTPAVLSGGRGGLALRRPGSGNNGSVILSLATGNSCVGAATPVSAAAVEEISWFGSAGNPAGRATFGIYKTPLIDRRERY